MSNTLHSYDPELVFTWCQDIYKEYNIDLRLPKARDVRNTYQYRYLTSICNKFKSWELSESDVKRFLRIAISNSHRQKTLKKGLSALHQKNLLQLSYEQLIISNDIHQQSNLTLDAVLSFLQKYCNNNDPHSVLRHRETVKSNMVITNLYQAGKINVEFLSVNDMCREIVMDAISNDLQDAMFLPNLGKIYKINRDISDHKNRFPNHVLIKKWGKV
jgi:hypothetical protein